MMKFHGYRCYLPYHLLTASHTTATIGTYPTIWLRQVQTHLDLTRISGQRGVESTPMQQDLSSKSDNLGSLAAWLVAVVATSATNKPVLCSMPYTLLVQCAILLHLAPLVSSAQSMTTQPEHGCTNRNTHDQPNRTSGIRLRGELREHRAMYSFIQPHLLFCLVYLFYLTYQRHGRMPIPS